MNAMKMGIIGLAVALAAVIGYAVYLHQGPIKNITNENQNLLAEIDQLKTSSTDMNSAHKAELNNRNLREKGLETKNIALEETLSRIKKETETLAADLQSTIKGLENQLAQWDRELQTSRKEVQKLRSTIVSLESSNKTLREKSADLDQQLPASRNQIAELQEERDQLNQNNIELRNQLAELQIRFQAISDDTTVKDQEIAEMEKNRQSLLIQIESQKKEKEELERLKNALKNQLGMTQSQIEELSMDVATTENRLKSKEQQLKSMKLAYEELSKQFERQIREKEIQINNLEDKLNIRLLDKILFGSGSADITSVGYPVLESLATELKKMDGFEITVAGHTDSKSLGPKTKQVYYDNLGLSVARAAAVSRALREMGVSPENLSAVGYSEYRPVAENDTREGRQQNRRVEIMLEPLR